MARVLLVEDDPAIAAVIADLLSDDGHDVVACSDAESAEIVLETTPVSALVSDVKLSGPFRFEGLDLLERAARLAPSILRVGMTGSATPGLENAVTSTGARFLPKPFPIGALASMLPAKEGDRDGHVDAVPRLEEILQDAAVFPRYQAIVDLARPSSILGFEALATFPSLGTFLDASSVFMYAERKNLTIELNLQCLRAAIANGAALPGSLFVNVDARVFSEGERLCEALNESISVSGIDPRRLVIELTEQHPFPDDENALQTLLRLRLLGIRFAFDDVGVAYSHLPMIGKISPEFLKISQVFGTGFERAPDRRKVVQNIVGLAREFGCAVILEGIEEADTASVARSLGIEYGQGYFFSRPSDPSTLSGFCEAVN